jgi:hypothetical protein
MALKKWDCNILFSLHCTSWVQKLIKNKLMDSFLSLSNNEIHYFIMTRHSSRM